MDRMLDIAVINNMPDAALRRTEQQFVDLIDSAAESLPVRVRMHALPAVKRGEAARQHIAATYLAIDTLWRNPPDAIVVTGTEPRERNLADEPYWGAMTSLIDWADAKGIPALFSCLAAHAAVLHTDAVARLPLEQKCFGVFEHDVAPAHDLTNGVGPGMSLPHTRWNQVSRAALADAGYQVLSESPAAGVGFFARERRSLWLYCQGHPEYDGANLAREYRRDVQRYLRGERATYPALPENYFGHEDTALLNAFRARALAERDVSIMDTFPTDLRAGPTWDTWRPASIRICANWLNYVAQTMSAGRTRAMAM
jgi:homoserine O-succinyltransferase